MNLAGLLLLLAIGAAVMAFITLVHGADPPPRHDPAMGRRPNEAGREPLLDRVILATDGELDAGVRSEGAISSLLASMSNIRGRRTRAVVWLVLAALCALGAFVFSKLQAGA